MEIDPGRPKGSIKTEGKQTNLKRRRNLKIKSEKTNNWYDVTDILPSKKIKLHSKLAEETKDEQAVKSEYESITNLKTEYQDVTDGAVSLKKKSGDIPMKEEAKSGVDCILEGTAVSWYAPDVIAAKVEVPNWAAKNVVKLLDDGCTIPFIARYPKEQTGAMEVPKLRDVSSLLEELR